MTTDELIAWVVAQKMYGTFSAHQFQLKIQEHAPQIWKHYEYWFRYGLHATTLSTNDKVAKIISLLKAHQDAHVKT